MKRTALGIFVLGLITTGGLPARAAEAEVLPRAEQRLGGLEGTEVPDFQRHVLPLMGGFLDGLPQEGVVMCHPGFVDDVLVSLDPLTKVREVEPAYLASEDFPRLLAMNKVTLS